MSCEIRGEGLCVGVGLVFGPSVGREYRRAVDIGNGKHRNEHHKTNHRHGIQSEASYDGGGMACRFVSRSVL
jgi:hypothetical protein